MKLIASSIPIVSSVVAAAALTAEIITGISGDTNKLIIVFSNDITEDLVFCLITLLI
jgi:hypothetical protein